MTKYFYKKICLFYIFCHEDTKFLTETDLGTFNGARRPALKKGNAKTDASAITAERLF